MEPTTPSRNYAKWILFGVIVLVIVAGLLGWKLGQHQTSNQTVSNTTTPTATNNSPASKTEVSSLVSYTLPDGWREGTCPESAHKVFIVPAGASLQCSANPSAPVKIYVDANNTNDCQQLGNVQNVKKHICKSLYINGHKSLQAQTEYPKSDTYPEDTTISSYYIDTGKGVIAVEYTYKSSNNYQIGFDQLANSVKSK